MIQLIFYFCLLIAPEPKKTPSRYFWYEIGMIKTIEILDKSEFLTEYEKKKLWVKIDSARKSDSLSMPK